LRRLLPFLLVSLLAPRVHAAPIDDVRASFLAYTTAAGADRNVPRMREALSALESEARRVSAPGYLLGDGSWNDINYSDTPAGDWSPWNHVRRLAVMAKAYRTPGQALYNDPALRAAIESALGYVPRFYGYWTIPTGNWWFWTIGIPLDLGPTLVLMRGDVSVAVYDDCVRAMAIKIGSSPASKGLVGPTPVGENLTWSCFTHLSLALLKDDAVMLAAVRDAMTTACTPTDGDGIQADNSFHQHGAQLYNGGYGAAFASDVARYELLTRGTEFALPQAALATFAGYVADGIAWSMLGSQFDVSVVGRYVARPSTSGYDGLAALIQAAQFDSPRRGEIRAAAAKALQMWNGPLPPELAAQATAIEQANFAAAWPSGHQHAFTSDYTLHRRAGWLASVKMFSSRTKSGERTNGENLLGSRQSDGRFHLVLDGDEYFGNDDVFAALDWSRLPGITVEQSATAADDTYGFGTRAFAGGTGDSTRGVSAMDVAPLGSTLTAKKAWFFFDDAVMFLTNSITAPSANRVETIVEQWPLRDAGAYVTREGDWLACDNIGYWFPSGGALHADRLTRTGSWAALGASTDTTPRTSTFLTLWLDHGVNPAAASAAYAIVPRVTPAGMRAWAGARPLSILANDARVSAVRDNRDNALGIVFWTAGASVDGISSSLPAVVWITHSSTSLTLGASDPTNGSGTFTITLPGAWSGSGAVTNGVTTTLTIPRNGGRTSSVTLKPVTQKRRIAGR
jgi:hypothetical protein